jgi:2-keto-4-pentenoate hydratase
MNKFAEAAEFLVRHRIERTPLPPLAIELRPQTLAEGYDIQDQVHRLLGEKLGGIVGYKIGCTSDIMQSYLGIAHPCAGGTYANNVLASGASCPMSDFVRVGIECEIAVRLARDVEPSADPYVADSIADAVECYFPAIEIVDDRYVEWQTLGAPTLIADDFFASSIVLGKPVAASQMPDLRTMPGIALVNGKEVGRGTGADLMGSPLNALAWLANHMSAQGRSLRAGQTVMTGSIVQTVWMSVNDHVEVEFSGLGRAEVRFT